MPLFGRREFAEDIAPYLLPEETPWLWRRQHPIVLAKKVAAAVVTLLVLLFVLVDGGDSRPSRGQESGNAQGLLVNLLIIALLVLSVRALLAYDWWRRQWFVVTDKRVLLVSSFIGHTVSHVSHSRVTHMTYDRTIPGQILGYGHFVFQSAGKDHPLYTMRYIPGGIEMYRAVTQMVTSGAPPRGSGGVGGRAVLAALSGPAGVVRGWGQRLFRGDVLDGSASDPTARPALPTGGDWYRRLRGESLEDAPSTASATGARHQPLDEEESEGSADTPDADPDD